MSMISDLATMISFLIMVILKIIDTKIITSLLCGVNYEKKK